MSCRLSEEYSCTLDRLAADERHRMGPRDMGPVLGLDAMRMAPSRDSLACMLPGPVFIFGAMHDAACARAFVVAK